MPFERKTIEALFERPELAWYLKHENFKESTNYSSVVSYLTGEQSSLQGLVADHANFSFHALTDLVQNLVAPSPDEERVLEVLFHPNVVNSVQYYLFFKLTGYWVQHDNDQTAQAILKLFGKAGLQRAQIFDLLLFHLRHLPESIQLFHNRSSSIKSFLLHHLPPAISQHQRYPVYVSGDWNYLYFLLIEEAQPHLLEQYFFMGLSSMQENIMATLLLHGEGKYVPAIKHWIKEPPKSENDLQAKFLTAILLFEQKGEELREEIQEIAKTYLQQCPSYFSKHHWEAGFYFKPLTDVVSPRIPFSALAVHFLLPQEKELVKEVLSQWLTKKINFSVAVFRVLQHHLKEEALPLLTQGLQTTAAVGGNDYYRDIIDVLVKNFVPAHYLPILWPLAATKSKVVREIIAQIFIEHDPGCERKAIDLLKHRNAEARQTGAFILNSFDSTEAIAAVNDLLDKETNDNTRDIFLQIVKDSLPQNADDGFRQQVVESALRRKKLAKPVEPWLDETELPLLFDQAGAALSVTEVRFLFYRMSRIKGMRSETEANYVLRVVDRNTAGPFAKALIDRYTSNGTKPEHKYLLALAALLGGENTVDAIRQLVNRWIEEGRLKMAEYGVGALALQGSNKALRWVEWYSRKYKTKKANIGGAALQALEDAAEEQGITVYELGDRVVPDFGFENLYKTFAVNGDEYRAFIDSRFKLSFFNEENKQLKTLPAGASVALKEEVKQIAKEIRDVVRSQSGRMECYLLIQRKWASNNWKEFFLTHPVMFIYATKLLWGVFNEEGQLLNCFYCQEDTSLLDVDDNEIEVEENCLVGIVHPLQLSAEQVTMWKRKFFGLAIEPIFLQLDRPVYTLQPADTDRKIVQTFAGKQTEPNFIRSTLERFGWRAGGAADGGYIDAFHLTDSANRIVAVLEVEGVFVGFGYDQEPKLGRLYFIDLKKQKNKWIQSSSGEEDERLIELKDLPPVFYSEVIYNVNSIRLRKAEVLSSEGKEK